MRIPSAVFGAETICRIFCCFTCVVVSAAASRSADLYNLDFTAPDVGSYQVTLGSPSVQPSVGPFTDALVFDGLPGGEQIQLPIETIAPGYNLQFDVLAHGLANSDYSFGIYLGTATAHAVRFHGGLNSVYVYQNTPFLNFSLTPFADDLAYHFDISLSAPESSWSVAINGTSLFSGPLDSTALQDIRFGISPWIGGAANAPNTYVALDNVLVSTIPEPSISALVVAGIFAWWKSNCRKNQNRS